jgi:hypothetical protein
LQVENYIRPRLRIRWPELTIVHRFVPLIYQLSKSVNVTYLQVYRLRQILKHPHFVLMYVKFGIKSRILPLMESGWGMQSAEINVRQQSRGSAPLPRDSHRQRMKCPSRRIVMYRPYLNRPVTWLRVYAELVWLALKFLVLSFVVN